jgi:hypothetical protein
MDEVDERALRQAREQLADDAHVAALLAAGDPAAERAALALAINAGSSAQGRRGAEEWAWYFLSGFHLRDLSINKRPSGRFFLDAAASAHQKGCSPGCDMPADCAPLSRLERVPEPLDFHRA